MTLVRLMTRLRDNEAYVHLRLLQSFNASDNNATSLQKT